MSDGNHCCVRMQNKKDSKFLESVFKLTHNSLFEIRTEYSHLKIRTKKTIQWFYFSIEATFFYNELIE